MSSFYNYSNFIFNFFLFGLWIKTFNISCSISKKSLSKKRVTRCICTFSAVIIHKLLSYILCFSKISKKYCHVAKCRSWFFFKLWLSSASVHTSPTTTSQVMSSSWRRWTKGEVGNTMCGGSSPSGASSTPGGMSWPCSSGTWCWSMPQLLSLWVVCMAVERSHWYIHTLHSKKCFTATGTSDFDSF